jgi:chromosomal replication initiator protein
MQATAKLRPNADMVKSALAEKMDAAVFASWIAPLKISVADDCLNIAAQNQFSSDFIRRTYLSQIETIAADFNLSVSLCVKKPVQSAAPVVVNDAEARDYIAPAVCETADSFSNFIMSDANAFAVSAAKKMAAGSAGFSPLFIHGPSGCGKTRLANCINSASNGKTIMMTGMGFVSEFVRAMNDKSVFAFKDFCRGCDTFIMDDVHALAGKRASCDEFFALVCDLIRNGKNVVLVSNAAPNAMTGFDRRMQSVFASGLVVDVAAPDSNVRRRMLSAAGVPLDVAASVAPRVAADGHLVMGVAKKIQTYSELMNEKITLEIAERLVSDTVQKNKTPMAMVRARCVALGVSYDMVCSASRLKSVVRARQMMMAALKMGTKLSLSEIGRVLGDRDHATVLYGISQIEKSKSADLVLCSDIDRLISECK